VIDGKDDDAVWKEAPSITEFYEFKPTEMVAPRFRTEAKVAYDAANLYVFVRAFDPHPDSIIRLLERRDTQTPSDKIIIALDSYHDRRTGYEFGVNPAGVKFDIALYDDNKQDMAWDAVWDVATRIDSLGWSAEFRIPLSQLHYRKDRNTFFGLLIARDIYRYGESVSWPAFKPSKPGTISQCGTLDGLHDLEAPRRLEALPYIVAKSASKIAENQYTTQSNVSLGGDLRSRMTSNITVDATINPDFGQVEADPAVLNLTAYESFFDEHRPFFVAQRGLFRFDVNCNEVNCNNEGLYYSRRIGQTPELAKTYGDTVPLQPTPIVGAVKLSGRLRDGLTLGVLDAVTQRVTGAKDTTFEPTTNFAAIRMQQNFRDGNGTIGGIVTAVNRNTDQWSSPYLVSSAYVGGIDARYRFWNNTYEMSGSLDASVLHGSPSSIFTVQTDAVHNYQRPDANFLLDSTRMVLRGNAEEVKFDKVGGEYLMFESAYQRRSEGFEVNDLGYLRRADQQAWSTWVGLFDRHERTWYKRLQWNNSWWQNWTTAGLPLQAAYNTNMQITTNNNWTWSIGTTIGQLGTTYDDRAARGGPAVRQDPYLAPSLTIQGNDRRSLVPSLSVNMFRGDAGRNSSVNVNPWVDCKMSGQFSSTFSVGWSRNVMDNQWYGNFVDSMDRAHYTFAHLVQYTAFVTTRLNYTFTPNISFQTYAQPFISKGTFQNVRQLSATPRARAYNDRYVAYDDPTVTDNPGGFHFKEFQSNVVFRWEYLPGSMLFLVWNEGRQGVDPTMGANGFREDVRDLFRLHPSNTVLLKISYWCTP